MGLLTTLIGTDNGASLLADLAFEGGTYTKTGDTDFSDVDAANLAVTFTVPANGEVRVVLCGFAAITSPVGGHRWGLRQGAADVAGSARLVTGYSGTSTYVKRFSGLTPGASLTWKWAFATTEAAETATIQTGAFFGAASMEVWSIPS